MPTVSELVRQASQTSDPAILRELGAHRSKTVRSAVADNPAADDITIAALLDDRSHDVRLAAAGNLTERPDLHERAARSSDAWVRAITAHTYAGQDDRSLALDVQRILADDSFAETRGRIAETTNDLDLFEHLMRDGSPTVRGWCASNPRITREQMERLVSDRRLEVRAAAAANGLRYPDDEQLLRLARDRSAEVRWAVLFRVDLPRAAVELITQDPDEMNRQHAQMALRDEHAINGEGAIESARAERTRVDRLLSFPAESDDTGRSV